MKRLSRYAVVFVISLLISQAALAQLISVDELAEMMEKGEVVVVSARAAVACEEESCRGSVGAYA